MARAISRLGVARGIEAFVRYATWNGTDSRRWLFLWDESMFDINPRAYLIDDLAAWMDRVQRRSRTSMPRQGLFTPSAVWPMPSSLLSRTTTRLIAGRRFCRPLPRSNRSRRPARPSRQGRSLRFAQSGLPQSTTAVPKFAWRLRWEVPPQATHVTAGPVDPVRHHWLPLEPGARRFKTSEKRLAARSTRRDVGSRSHRAISAAIVERRLIEAGMKGQRRSPLVAARAAVPA